MELAQLVSELNKAGYAQWLPSCRPWRPDATDLGLQRVVCRVYAAHPRGDAPPPAAGIEAFAPWRQAPLYYRGLLQCRRQTEFLAFHPTLAAAVAELINRLAAAGLTPAPPPPPSR